MSNIESNLWRNWSSNGKMEQNYLFCYLQNFSDLCHFTKVHNHLCVALFDCRFRECCFYVANSNMVNFLKLSTMKTELKINWLLIFKVSIWLEKSNWIFGCGDSWIFDDTLYILFYRKFGNTWNIIIFDWSCFVERREFHSKFNHWKC